MDQGAAVPPSRRIGSAPASEINYSGLIPYPPHLPLTLSDDVSVPGSEGLASNPSRAPPFLTGRSLLHKVGWERREKTPPGLCTLRPPCVLGAPHSTFRRPCLKHMLWSTYWVPGLVPKVGNTESPRREGWGQLDRSYHAVLCQEWDEVQRVSAMGFPTHSNEPFLGLGLAWGAVISKLVSKVLTRAICSVYC